MTHVNDPGATTVRRELWFESGGTRLYAVEVGEGRPIVFLHGGLADHRSALFRVGELSTSFRVLAPDLRAAGRSIHHGELSWEMLADDVAALLDHLGVERAVVGGTSMGTGVAVHFALRHPRRTAGLLLTQPMHRGEDRGLTEAQARAIREMNDAGRLVLEHGVEALLPLYETLPLPIRERAIDMMRGFDARSVAATTRFLASNVQPFATAHDLARIQAPALVVPGTDPEHPVEVAELYVRHLARATVVLSTSPELTARTAAFCASVALPSEP
jgi:pimeloyl-ACP methyl ester carboxylesterase